MAQIFPKSANKIPIIVIAVVAISLTFAVGLIWYYGSPKYTDVGYRPVQPINFSHKLHAGDLGMDCRYCHNQVEFAPAANVPTVQTCMNCHKLVGIENEKLLPLRESWATGDPVQWIRVHNLPDYAYFNHSAHVNAGVGCISCHGNVRWMPIITQVEPLSMSWCLECHRNPDDHLRPVSEITNMEWTPLPGHAEFVEQLKKDNQVKPPTDCSGCHR